MRDSAMLVRLSSDQQNPRRPGGCPLLRSGWSGMATPPCSIYRHRKLYIPFSGSISDLSYNPCCHSRCSSKGQPRIFYGSTKDSNKSTPQRPFWEFASLRLSRHSSPPPASGCSRDACPSSLLNPLIECPRKNIREAGMAPWNSFKATTWYRIWILAETSQGQSPIIASHLATYLPPLSCQGSSDDQPFTHLACECTNADTYPPTLTSS
jgi:hypothetical protein